MATQDTLTKKDLIRKYLRTSFKKRKVSKASIALDGPTRVSWEPVKHAAVKPSEKYTPHPRLLANAKWYQKDLQQQGEPRIRLLHLSSGNTDDPIVGTLECVSLNQAHPRYDALSYSWGDHKDWREIIVDGKPGFAVTLTLWQALRRLRSSSASRALWIDAICINQSHTSERNAQVLNMGNIFSSARSVIGWLGERGEEENNEIVKSQSNVDVYEFLSYLRKANRDPVRAWWNRVWVIQEVVLAKEITLYLGPHTMSWRKFCDSAEPQQHPIIGLARLRTEIRFWGSNNGMTTFADLLEKSGSFSASDPLDYVFALSGLVSHRRSELTPDYSLSEERLLEKLAKYLSPEEFDGGLFPDMLSALSLTKEQYRLINLRNWIMTVRHRGLCHMLMASKLLDPSVLEVAPLMLAAQHNSPSQVQCLIENGADLHCRDSQGATVVHYAARAGSGEAMRHLLSYDSIDVNAQDANQRTPLHVAVFHSYPMRDPLTQLGGIEALEKLSGTRMGDCLLSFFEPTNLAFTVFPER